MGEKRVSGGVSIAEATGFCWCVPRRDAEDESAKRRAGEGTGAEEHRLCPGRSRAEKPELREVALASSSFRRAGSDFFLPFFSKS